MDELRSYTLPKPRAFSRLFALFQERPFPTKYYIAYGDVARYSVLQPNFTYLSFVEFTLLLTCRKYTNSPSTVGVPYNHTMTILSSWVMFIIEPVSLAIALFITSEAKPFLINAD